jgi:modulator of FtsH protease
VNSLTPLPSTGRPQAAKPLPVAAGAAASLHAADTRRVLRYTYALLSMTLLFSAVVAAASVALQRPAPGLLLTLAGCFALLFAVHKLQNRGWALPAVFALTGFMGYSLGPVLAQALALPGGAQVVTMALAATGATFLAAVFLQMPALGLAVSAMVALLSAGLILYETSRIVTGGETNYVLATVGLHVAIFNLFTSLLGLFGIGGNEE